MANFLHFMSLPFWEVAMWIPLRIAAALLVFVHLSSSQLFPGVPPHSPRSYVPGPQYCPKTGGTICEHVEFYPMREIGHIINMTEARHYNLSSLFMHDQRGDTSPNKEKILSRPMPHSTPYIRRPTPATNYATTRRPTYQGNTRGFRPVTPQSPVGETWHSVTASYGPVAMPAPSSEIRGQVGLHYGQPPQRRPAIRPPVSGVQGSSQGVPVIHPARPDIQQASHQEPPVISPARRPVREEIPQSRPIATRPSSDQDRRIEQGPRFGQRVRPPTQDQWLLDGLVAESRSEDFPLEVDPVGSGELPMTSPDVEGSGEMKGNDTSESGAKIIKRSIDDIGEPLCRSREIYVEPRAGINEHSEWRYIINAPEGYPGYRQVVRSEVCHDRSCTSSLLFMDGMTGRCSQRYTKRRLITLATDGTYIGQENFFVPSCCVCEVRGPNRN